MGEHSWQPTHSGQIEAGWFHDNSNFTFPEPSLPYTNGLALGGPQTVVLTNVNITSSSTNASVYPGVPPWSGVSINIVSINTVTIYPGLKWGLTTNVIGTTNVTTYPGPIAGLSTNISGSTTVTSYPGPVYGLSTNWDPYAKSKTLPVTGTYQDPPGWTKQGAWYYYTGISGYSYPNLSYSYPNKWSWSYPVFNFNYALYQTNVVYTTNTYDHVLDNTSGRYYVDSLSGSILVRGADVQLVIANGLSMSGNDSFVIAPGGDIKVFCGGTSCTVGGNGILNQNGYAGNLILTCMPSVTSVSFNGNGEIIGVLVAPDAHITMNGGGHSNNDFIGALIADSITMNGHFSFHYDEALGSLKNNQRMVITSWDEIKAQ